MVMAPHRNLRLSLSGLGGELTPKRVGKLPIATTPPSRLLKSVGGNDVELSPGKASKAITDKVLSRTDRSDETILDRLQAKSPRGGTPAAEPKSPKSKQPMTPKQKAQTKSPIHLMFSPTASSKYPMIKSKSVSTPSSGDKGEFQYPPPKSPKSLSSSMNKKQQEPHTKQEEGCLDRL